MQVEKKKISFSRKNIKILYKILYGFSKKIQCDHVSSFAGHAALFLLTSLFPMAMYCRTFSTVPAQYDSKGAYAAFKADYGGGVCGKYHNRQVIYDACNACLCG